MDQLPYFIVSPGSGNPLYHAVITPITTLFPVTPFISSPVPWFLGNHSSNGPAACMPSVQISSNISGTPSIFGPVPMLAPVPGSGSQTTPRKNYKPQTIPPTSPSINIASSRGNDRQIFLRQSPTGEIEATFIDPAQLCQHTSGTESPNIGNNQQIKLNAENSGPTNLQKTKSKHAKPRKEQTRSKKVSKKNPRNTMATNVEKDPPTINKTASTTQGICVNPPLSTNSKPVSENVPKRPESPFRLNIEATVDVAPKRTLEVTEDSEPHKVLKLSPKPTTDETLSPVYSPTDDASSDSDYGPEPETPKRKPRKNSRNKVSIRYSLKTDTNLLDSVLADGGLKSPVLRDGGFGCPSCPKVYKMRKHCRRHMVIHTGSKPFHCSVCKTQFCRQDSLQRHYTKCSQTITTDQ